MSKDYYVYMYIDPMNFEPFYVGKGKGDRLFHHMNEKGKGNKITKIKMILDSGNYPIISKIHENLTENAALNLEREKIIEIGTIKKIEGVKIGPLTNLMLPDLTQGQGAAVVCDETKKKISNSVKEYWTPERKRQKSEQMKKYFLCPESRDKTRIATKNGMNTQEGKERRSSNMKNKWLDKEYRDNMTNKISKTVQSEEFRSNNAKITRELWKDPEYRSKNHTWTNHKEKEKMGRE